MNLWKPIALVAVVGLGTSLAMQFAPTAAAGGPCYDQPHMAAANAQLHSARHELDSAEHNKGGWRVDAIKHTDDAIKESDRGCAFANGTGPAK
jgi:hypothetical protein